MKSAAPVPRRGPWPGTGIQAAFTRLLAPYNAYTRFNGASSGASGNNSLYLNAFVAY